MDFMSKERFEEAEKIEALKSKILKYVLYKKRTEQEVRQKFEDVDIDVLDDVIEYLKEAGYINDNEYIERFVKEYTTLKNLSIKELSYKIIQKGVNKNLVDDYICKNREFMVEYEISSAKKIITKKRNSNVEDDTIKSYLYQKGYMTETINIAFDDLDG